MARRRHYKRPRKPHSRLGIWASGLAFFSLVCCVIVTTFAAIEPTELPPWTGALALLAMVENFFGLFLAVREARDEEKSAFFRVTGLAGTLLMCVVWISFYILGISLM